MIITHTTKRETYGDNTGRLLLITQVSYKDILGAPMAASFHGHLHMQTVKDRIKAYRAIDNEQVKA